MVTHGKRKAKQKKRGGNRKLTLSGSWASCSSLAVTTFWDAKIRQKK